VFLSDVVLTLPCGAHICFSLPQWLVRSVCPEWSQITVGRGNVWS